MGMDNSLRGQLDVIESELAAIDAQISELKDRRSELRSRKLQIEESVALQSESAQPSTSQINWECDDFPWSEDVRSCLIGTFGLRKFRPLQLSAINAILSSRRVGSDVSCAKVQDCLFIASTGAGKSLCYQLPAVLLSGITLVISPLLSLIEDQLIQLRRIGIEAATINQSSTKEEVKWVMDCLAGSNTSALSLLYVTPEKIAKSKRLMHQLEKCASQGRLCLIAVDEVHCCSQWGHDFRSDYQFLNVLKRQFRQVPLLGLTATATQGVLNDVKSILGVENAIVLRAAFNRPNLYYEVREKPGSGEKMVSELVELLKSEEFARSSGIIYCFSRKECEELTGELTKRGIKAAYYHAYVDADRRRQVHEGWLCGRYTVIVATTAFGMGIDKEDVRFVIHHSLAKSLENFYQESGRAGRDGKPARCILYYRLADAFRQSTMVCTERTGLKNLYAMLAYAIEKSSCRRNLIACHFGECWEKEWCDRMCDNCVANNPEDLDFHELQSTLLPAIKLILDEQSNSTKGGDQGRITGNKLADLIQRSRPKSSAQKRVAASTSRSQVEKTVARLMVDGYLREDFHFTPYSVISYLTLTAKGLAGRLVDGSARSKKRKESQNTKCNDVIVLS